MSVALDSAPIRVDVSGDGSARRGDVLVVPSQPSAPVPGPVVEVGRAAPRRLRPLRAYAVAARIALSYLWFAALARLRGAAWAAPRRAALHARNGRRARAAILRLRGLYVKAGQLASVLTQVLPEPFREQLDGLQDRVPAGPLAHVRARIEQELGAPPEKLFATFDARPVASASLAQVHRATLADGRAVAVKVQHADIEETARLDLRAVRTILAAAGRWFSIAGLPEQFRAVEQIIEEELDFRTEAQNRDALAALFAPGAGVSFPENVPERSARRVLTTLWAEGVPIGNLAALDAAGVDRARLVERLIAAYAQMIFRDGLYHADPHPGNVLVPPGGRAEIVLLDCGAVARLTPAMRRGLGQFVAGVVARDGARVAASLDAMGFVARSGGEAASAAAVRLVERLHARVFQGLDPLALRFADLDVRLAEQVSADAFGEMADLGVSVKELSSAFEVPRDWILFERTALLLIGVCTRLAPDVRPLRVLAPHVEALAREAAPDLLAAWGDRVWACVRQAFAFPETAARVVEAVDRGEATVRVPAVQADLAALTRRVEQSARRVVWAVLAVGAAAVGYAARVHGDGALALALGLGAVLAAAVALRGQPRRVSP